MISSVPAAKQEYSMGSRAAPVDVAPVEAAWRALPQRALVFFVSANAVQHFFAGLLRVHALAHAHDDPKRRAVAHDVFADPGSTRRAGY